MIIMIHQARVSGLRGSIVLSSMTFSIAAFATAASMGSLLGGVAGQLGTELRHGLVLAATAGALLGSLYQARPWQLDRETNRDWLGYQDWRTSAFNGGVLGLGFSTRLGYWLWYVVPIGVLAFGGWTAGAVLYGLYGLTRGVLGVVLAASAMAPRLRGIEKLFAVARTAARPAWFLVAGLVLGASILQLTGPV